MMGCLIFGDSIALGIGIAINALYAPGCAVIARTGASTAAIAGTPIPQHYGVVVISAGSNDASNPALIRDLVRLRTRLGTATRVIWIYPLQSPQAWSVYRVAIRYGDQALDISRHGSPDGIHPASYTAVARQLIGARHEARSGNSRARK